MISKLCIVLVLALIVENIQASANWGYEGEIGPKYWGGTCKGKSQSPINLSYDEASYKASNNPIRFKNYDKLPKESVLKNVGKTIKLEMKFKRDEDIPQIYGGDLPGRYAFAQLHYHWGEMDQQGSEHLVHNISYPTELHLVHYNTKYGNNLGDAIEGGKGAYDTLAVLGIFHAMSSKPNSDLDPIFKSIKDIYEPVSKSHTKLFPLEQLLPSNTGKFFRYNGSLTTPTCNEIVVWTVFQKPVTISPEQMKIMRQMGVKNKKMKNNYRPVQPLNGRKVYEYEVSSGQQITSYGIVFLGVLMTSFMSVIMG